MKSKFKPDTFTIIFVGFILVIVLIKILVNPTTKHFLACDRKDNICVVREIYKTNFSEKVQEKRFAISEMGKFVSNFDRHCSKRRSNCHNYCNILLEKKRENYERVKKEPFYPIDETFNGIGFPSSDSSVVCDKLSAIFNNLFFDPKVINDPNYQKFDFQIDKLIGRDITY